MSMLISFTYKVTYLKIIPHGMYMCVASLCNTKQEVNKHVIY